MDNLFPVTLTPEEQAAKYRLYENGAIDWVAATSMEQAEAYFLEHDPETEKEDVTESTPERMKHYNFSDADGLYTPDGKPGEVPFSDAFPKAVARFLEEGNTGAFLFATENY